MRKVATTELSASTFYWCSSWPGPRLSNSIFT